MRDGGGGHRKTAVRRDWNVTPKLNALRPEPKAKNQRQVMSYNTPLAQNYYGWKSVGIGGSSRISVMVTRRLAAM